MNAVPHLPVPDVPVRRSPPSNDTWGQTLFPVFSSVFRLPPEMVSWSWETHGHRAGQEEPQT